MISVHNISKSFGDFRALDFTTIEFPAGKTTVIVGQSGSGKSTLLRICVGLVKSDTGFVRFENSVVNAENLQSIRHQIGYVIQEGGLFPHLDARENILLLARHLRRLPEANDRLEELIDTCRLSKNLLGRYPSELSGGQRQRVGLMRSLILDPSVILLDEPLGALDPLMRSQLQNDLKEIFATLKKTVVFVTHDLGEAQYLGDHVILMHEAKIVQQGNIEDLIHRPAEAFVTSFLKAQRGFQCDL